MFLLKDASGILVNMGGTVAFFAVLIDPDTDDNVPVAPASFSEFNICVASRDTDVVDSAVVFLSIKSGTFHDYWGND